LAIELAGLLGRYWGRRGQYREGRERLAAALAEAPDAPASVRARAFRSASRLAQGQSDLDGADGFGREALALDREQHDRAAVSRDLNVLGAIALLRGNHAEATRLLEASLAEARLAGGTAHPPDALFHLVALAHSSGDYARAIELAGELVTRTKGRDSQGQAYALNLLGLSLEASGRTQEAQQSFEESIAVSRSHGYPDVEAYALASLAHLEQATRPSDAGAHYRASLALMHELGDQRGVAYCLEGLAAITPRGSATQAAMLLGAAAAIRERTGGALQPGAEQAEVDTAVEETRQALGADAFGAAWSVGGRMDLDQAIEFALRMTTGAHG
jgi:tetratricopeptide (TPR) repeat protein